MSCTKVLVTEELRRENLNLRSLNFETLLRLFGRLDLLPGLFSNDV